MRDLEGEEGAMMSGLGLFEGGARIDCSDG